MTGTDTRLLWESIVAHEGFSRHPVADTQGTLSIGFGRNLMTNGISQDEAAILLEHDLERIETTLRGVWPPFAQCDGPRQRTLIEMALQMGVDGLLTFRKLLHAVAVKNYAQAAEEVLHSTLATQTKARALDYAHTLRMP